MNIIDMYFPEAESPWIPTLLDIEHRKSNDVPGYADIGLDQVVVSPEHERMVAAWSRLVERFNTRYAYRMINSETLQRWQVRLQNRTDEIIDEYERAYRLFETYAQEMDSPIEGWVDTAKDTNSGSDSMTSAGSSKTADTPDTSFNVEDDFGSSVTKTDASGSTTYGRVLDRTATRRITGLGNLDSVISSFRSWVDLDTAFVEEYENLFLNIFWY